MNKLKYYYYRLMWHLAPHFKYGKFIHLDLELNTECNQSCIFCWHSNKEKKPAIQHFPQNQIENILRISKKQGAMSVKFNLRGEPLLSTNLFHAIESAKKLKYIDIMINTNGIRLSEINSLLLNHAGLTKCIISVDTFDSEIYKKLHNSSHHDILIKNLDDLHKLCVLQLIKFKVIINIHKNKYNEKESLKKYISKYYMFKFNIKKTMKREGKNISIASEKRERKSVCPHMMRRLTVHANGEIYPCCVSYSEPQELRLYDYIRTDVAWNSGKRRNMIEDYKNKKYTKICLECTSNDISK